jgi:hypothetical protein
MQCRSCRCYLDDEFRYCPRCGAPNSVAYPVAGAPWLRRPAAVVGLALLLIAWLAALQRQLWLPRGASSPPSTRIAARPPETVPALQQNATEPSPMPVPTATLWPHPPAPVSSRGAGRPETVQKNRGTRQPAAPRAPVALSRAVIARPPARHRGQGQEGDRAGTSAGMVRLAALPAAPRGRYTPRSGSSMASRGRSWMTGSRRASDPWRQPAVFVRSPGRAPAPFERIASGLTVNISARPYGVKTWVFMDGGKRLGQAPLRVRFDRPGRHHLLFFAPDLGPSGRVNRTIEVTGRNRQWVSATMGPTREFARLPS